MNIRRVLRGVCQVKKGSYVDPLVMRISLKSEFLIGNFNQHFCVFCETSFAVFPINKSVLKKTQIFGPNFEPCSSCVAVDSFFSNKKPGNTIPPQRVILRYFLTMFVQVSQMSIFFFFGGGGRGLGESVDGTRGGTRRGQT